MIPIYVDPALLALPNGLAETADELASLVDRVVELSSWARDCHAFVFIKSHDLEASLESSGAFPTFQIIKDTLDANELLDTFNAKDILVSILNIMSRAVSAFEFFGADVLNATISEPFLVTIFNRFPADVRQMSINSLASIGFLKSVGKISGAGFCVSGHPLLIDQTMSFEGQIDDIVSNEQTKFVIPVNVTEEINLVDSPQGVVDCGKALLLWHFARDAADIHVALEARVRELMQSEVGLQRTISSFSIGSEFIRSLKANQAFGSGSFASTTIDVCARILLGTPKYDVNDFGERPIDAAQGKRTHITKHRPALRLLFWVHGNGEIEFANVGQKNELKIEDGHIGGRVLIAYPK